LQNSSEHIADVLMTDTIEVSDGDQGIGNIPWSWYNVVAWRGGVSRAVAWWWELSTVSLLRFMSDGWALPKAMKRRFSLTWIAKATSIPLPNGSFHEVSIPCSVSELHIL
jgi:hypothetical protein